MATAHLRPGGLALLIAIGMGTATAQTLPDTTKIYMQMASVDPILGDVRAYIHVSGYGQPGNQEARGYGGLLLMSLTQPPDPTQPNPSGVLLEVSYVGETGGSDLPGEPNVTRLYIFIRYTNDQLFFQDSTPTITTSGRHGDAILQIPTGTFRNAVGGVDYDFECTQGCPEPGQTIQDASFDGKLTGTVVVNLPTQVAKEIFPNLFAPPPAAPQQTPTPQPVSTQTNGDGSTAMQAEKNAGILPNLVKRDDATGSAGTPFFTVTPTLQTSNVTYNATATCANLPTGCWLSAPSPSGSISAFTTAAIQANYNISSLTAGVYPADFAVAITSDPSTPPVVQDAKATAVISSAPALQISEQGVHFQALAGQGSQSAPSIAARSQSKTNRTSRLQRVPLIHCSVGGRPAIADGDHAHLVLVHQVDEPGFGLGAALFLADQVNHGLVEQIAEFVDGHELAAALEAGIDGQHARRSRSAAAAAGFAGLRANTCDGVQFGMVGQLASAPWRSRLGSTSRVRGIAGAAAHKLGGRMIGPHQQLIHQPETWRPDRPRP